MQYIKEGGSLPVPFNIIPTPKTIFNLIKKLKKSKETRPKARIELNDLPSKNGLQSKKNINGPNGQPALTNSRVCLCFKYCSCS